MPKLHEWGILFGKVTNYNSTRRAGAVGALNRAEEGSRLRVLPAMAGPGAAAQRWAKVAAPAKVLDAHLPLLHAGPLRGGVQRAGAGKCPRGGRNSIQKY